MSQNQEEEKEGIFNVMLIGALLFGGAIGGGAMARHVIPDSQIASIVGLGLLPLGIILGLSVAQGAAPPLSLLNLFSVLDGRHKMDDIMPNGGVLKLQLMLMLMPVAFGVVMALVLDMFVKPDAPFTEIAIWFAGSGFGFGVVVAGLIMLLVPE